MNSPSPTPDDALRAFEQLAGAQTTATVKALVEQAAKPALAELEEFRAALDARVGGLAARLSDSAATIDPNPIRALVERLAHAAREEAATAAQAARTLAIQEADARLERDRAEAQRQLDAMREEAAEQRHAGQLERAALADALEKTKQQADAMRADRDAQLDALHRAQEQAEAIRADRDAQLAALRAAQEQADNLRADRDAQLAALRTAQEQADALRADRDAQLEAVRVAAERVAAIGAERDAHLRTAAAASEEAKRVQSEQDALLEAARISNVRHARLLEEAQARADASQAHAAAAQTQAAEAQAQAEAAHAQLAAARDQAEAAQAQLDAAQAQLAEARHQLAAAQAEAERRLAIGASEIEALRLELERVRADMQSARVEPAPVVAVDRPVGILPPVIEAAASAPVMAAAEQIECQAAPIGHGIEYSFDTAIEVVNDPVPEPVVETVGARSEQASVIEQTAMVTEPVPVQLRVVQAEPPAEPAPVVAPVLLAVAEPDPVQEAAEVDSIGVMYRAIGGAADLSQVLDALIDGVGALFPRAALFVVKTKSKRLQGWRSVGFTGVAAITREFEFPLTTDSALTRAVTASRTIFTGEGQPGAQAGEAWTVTFPVTTGGRVVAVVHADGGGRTGEAAPAFDRETALDLAHTLVRMAGERIGALTLSARTAFGNVMSVAPVEAAPVNAGGAHVNGSRANGTPVNGSHVDAAQVNVVQTAPAPVAAEDAERYASQLVSEINRYAQAAAAAAPDNRTLEERLAGQIEGANAPAPPPPATASAAPASALGMFDEALNKMLGNGGLEQTPVAVQSV